jgi:hypothetical protein
MQKALPHGSGTIARPVQLVAFRMPGMSLDRHARTIMCPCDKQTRGTTMNDARWQTHGGEDLGI